MLNVQMNYRICIVQETKWPQEKIRKHKNETKTKAQSFHSYQKNETKTKAQPFHTYQKNETKTKTQSFHTYQAQGAVLALTVCSC